MFDSAARMMAGAFAFLIGLIAGLLGYVVMGMEQGWYCLGLGVSVTVGLYLIWTQEGNRNG